jgi:hypothetical protein
MATLHCRNGERRRTVRVSVFVDLTVQGIDGQNQRFKIRTRSLSVSGHGGLTVLDVPVSVGQTLILANEHSKQKAECRVVSLRLGGHGKTIVSFAFLTPQANFWKMSFPPPGTKPSADRYRPKPGHSRARLLPTSEAPARIAPGAK